MLSAGRTHARELLPHTQRACLLRLRRVHIQALTFMREARVSDILLSPLPLTLSLSRACACFLSFFFSNPPSYTPQGRLRQQTLQFFQQAWLKSISCPCVSERRDGARGSKGEWAAAVASRFGKYLQLPRLRNPSRRPVVTVSGRLRFHPPTTAISPPTAPLPPLSQSLSPLPYAPPPSGGSGSKCPMFFWRARNLQLSRLVVGGRHSSLTSQELHL